MTSIEIKKLIRIRRVWWIIASLALVIAVGAVTWNWRNNLYAKFAALVPAATATPPAPKHDEHEGEAPSASHDHEAEVGHTGESETEATASATFDHVHSDSDALKLGAEAQKNIGVNLEKVELRAFERTTTVPGIVVERPGWGSVAVTGAMNGIVTRVYPIQGQSVKPGDRLFEIRLTHEDLLQTQREFLQSIEELDVIRREVARLEKVAQDGAIPGKTLLERKYEQQKQEAALRAERQALLLHGISEEQLQEIERSRTLLASLTIFAPAAGDGTNSAATGGSFQVQDLQVSRGSLITPGVTLCRLADYTTLYIEGNAFEQDLGPVGNAAAKRLHITAYPASEIDNKSEPVRDLRILYLDDKVKSDTRTFRFYVELPNRVIREDSSSDGRKFEYWQFKPGQRMSITLPIETWPNRIVLPTEAVAQDGADYYVFELNDGHFDRRAVHVEYRDANWVVVANDGSIKPGVTVAASAAYQMQMAIKNKSGGAIDPHAGHNH